MKKTFLKATRSVLIYFTLLLVVILIIGGDKWQFGIQIFGLPWSYVFALDPFGEYPPVVEFLSFYGGVLLNAVIIYALSYLILNKKIFSR